MPKAKLSEAQIWLVDYWIERLGKRGVICPEQYVFTEYRFSTRRWRFDVAIPAKFLGFEIEGGLYTRGAHVRGAHYESDMLKYNTATALGWRVLRWTPRQVLKGVAKEFLEQYII